MLPLCMSLTLHPAAGTEETGVRWRNGDFMSGVPESASAGRLTLRPRWSPEPLSLPVDRLRHFQNPEAGLEGGVSDVRLRLANGDRIGLRNLVLEEGGPFQAETSWGGRLRIPAEDIDHIRLVSADRLVQTGPDTGGDWEVVNPRDLIGMPRGVFAGRAVLALNAPQLQIRSSTLPERFLLELEVSVDPEDTSYRVDLFRPERGSAIHQLTLQVTNQQIMGRWYAEEKPNRRVMQRWIRNLESVPVDHRLQVYGDRATGRLLFRFNGDVMAHAWDFEGIRDELLDGGFIVAVHRASRASALRVRSFQLLKWDGEPTEEATVPSAAVPGLDTLAFYDGGRVSGDLLGVGPGEVRFQPASGGDVERYDRDKVFEIRLASGTPPGTEPLESGLPVLLYPGRDGDRLHATLEELRNGVLTLARAGWPDRFEVPLDAVQLLRFAMEEEPEADP